MISTSSALARIRPPEWTDSLRVFGGLVQTARPMDPPHRELQREPSLKAQAEETRKSHVLGGLILRSFIKIKGREIYLYSEEGRKAIEENKWRTLLIDDMRLILFVKNIMVPFAVPYSSFYSSRSIPGPSCWPIAAAPAAWLLTGHPGEITDRWQCHFPNCIVPGQTSLTNRGLCSAGERAFCESVTLWCDRPNRQALSRS